MLDAHPALAVLPETRLAPRVIKTCWEGEVPPEHMIEVMADHPRWGDFGVRPEALLDRLRAMPSPLNAASTLRAFYRLYAEGAGKPRWGDKTPRYLAHMLQIQAVLPEARFVHLIRDGRDVALSFIGQPFGPDSVAGAAQWWRKRISGGRALAPLVEHYLETRYEDLILDPETTLRRVCDFLDLGWDPRMLDYHRHAGERMRELDRDRARGSGGPPLGSVERLSAHALTSEPPRRDRVGRWQREMSHRDQRAFEHVAGAALDELGYEVGGQAARPRARSPFSGTEASAPKIVMTLVVRDQDDVLDASLRYHLCQGVDFVLATDSGSQDASLEVLRRYERAGILHVAREPRRDDGELRSQWITRMARRAAIELKADWVIHGAADEFWWPAWGTLKDVLGTITRDGDFVSAPKSRCTVSPIGSGSWPERALLREVGVTNGTKVAHRGRLDVVVDGAGDRVARERHSEHRGLTDAAEWPIRILHLPLGGQVDRKFRSRDRRRAPAAQEARIEAALRKGTLVVDSRVRDFLARCPDPASASRGAEERHGVQSVERPSRDQAAAELAALRMEMADLVP